MQIFLGSSIHFRMIPRDTSTLNGTYFKKNLLYYTILYFINTVNTTKLNPSCVISFRKSVNRGHHLRIEQKQF